VAETGALAANGAILTINAGSSSIKFTLYAEDGAALIHGQVDGIGQAPHFVANDPGKTALADKRWDGGAALTHEALFADILDWIDHHLGDVALAAVGHRVVHGGAEFTAPVRLTLETIAALEKLSPLAPLHQPHNLAPVRAIAALRPALPQVACFDTAFHHTVPAVATQLALPHRFAEAGVRRYGFHGLSYEFIAGRLREVAPEVAGGRVIVAHLGNGASLCAMRNGHSVETSMGFTALDGLMMGTRCGTLDAGVVLYMLQQMHLSASEIEHVLYKESGLLGVSGISSDMRTLLASADARAAAAIDLFVWRIVKETGAMAAALGGLDAFVFTAGIGEHAPQIRRRVCEGLAWLGVIIGEDPDAAAPHCLSAPDSRVSVWEIPTDEEAMIWRHVREVLSA
jgi:acetate kinase